MRKLVPFAVLSLMAVGACTGDLPPSQVMPTASPQDFVNGGECPLADSEDLPERAGCVTKVGGASETVTVYAIVGQDSRPRYWRVRYESADEAIDHRLKAGNPFSYPRAIAAIDVGNDGTREWLLKSVDLASHGTNWQRLGLFVVKGNALEAVSFEGEPLHVNVGGTSRMGEGARCDGESFVLLRAEAENTKNTVWTFSERIYEIEGSKATFIDRRTGQLRLSDYNDPQLDPYFQVMCGSFVYP